jgi:Tfp pilus assembly protein PilX
MNTKQQLKTLDVDAGEKGVVLIAAIALMAVLALVGVVAAVTTSTEIKISSNYKTSVQADCAAEAGIEHARQVLKTLNAGSTDTGSFSDELAGAAGADMALEGYTGADDVPIVNTTNLGNGSYTVYLTNDPVDGSTNQTDNNNTACLTSVATTSEGSKSVIEMTLSIVAGGSFTPAGTVSMLGSVMEFVGGTGVSKAYRGDDQCGSDPPKPVIAVSDAADVSLVQSRLNKLNTYHTKDEYGNDITANDDPNAIVAAIPQSEIDSVNSNIGVDLLDPVSLDNWVADIQAQADTVAPDGSEDATVYLGNTSDQQVVVVRGDFTMTGDAADNGAGILVVTGTLNLYGSPNYTGLILVIGEGYLHRFSGGPLYSDGIFNGAIILAKTTGGLLGSPYFDVDGNGNGTIQYCSTAVDNAFSLISSSTSTLKPVAVRDIR